MVTTAEISELATACVKAQLELKPAVKDALNPAFRSKYADLAAIMEAAKVYAKHGIAIFQDVISSEAGVSVVTRLAHISGQWMEFGPFTVPLAKRDAHGVGSAATYAKRYSLSAALAIAADDDDDANEAAGVIATKPAAKPVAAAPKGFDDWLLDLTTVAETGTMPLKAAWDESPPAMRKHLLDTNRAKWDTLKAEAVRTDAKSRAKVSA